MNAVKIGCVGLALGLAIAGCSESSKKGISIDEIAKGGHRCADLLWEATTQAGDYKAAQGSSAPLPTGPDSPLANGKGAGVECNMTTPELDLTLVAVRDGAAVNVLLPKLQQVRQLTTAQVEAVARTAATTRPGHLVTLPGEGPASLGVVKVRGARSAAFVLTAEDGGEGGPPPDKVATRLASNLA